MNFTYKLIANLPSVYGSVENKCVLRKEDNIIIPFDEANTDYQEYLEWVAEGNTAEAAD